MDDIKSMDVEEEEGGWAGHHEEVDYSKEVVFSDSSDDDSSGRQSKTSDQPAQQRKVKGSRSRQSLPDQDGGKGSPQMARSSPGEKPDHYKQDRRSDNELFPKRHEYHPYQRPGPYPPGPLGSGGGQYAAGYPPRPPYPMYPPPPPYGARGGHHYPPHQHMGGGGHRYPPPHRAAGQAAQKRSFPERDDHVWGENKGAGKKKWEDKDKPTILAKGEKKVVLEGKGDIDQAKERSKTPQKPGDQLERPETPVEAMGDKSSKVTFASDAETEEVSGGQVVVPEQPTRRGNQPKIMLRKLGDKDTDVFGGRQEGKDRPGDGKKPRQAEMRGGGSGEEGGPEATSKTKMAWNVTDRGPIITPKTLYEPEGKKSADKFKKYHAQMQEPQRGAKGEQDEVAGEGDKVKSPTEKKEGGLKHARTGSESQKQRHDSTKEKLDVQVVGRSSPDVTGEQGAEFSRQHGRDKPQHRKDDSRRPKVGQDKRQDQGSVRSEDIVSRPKGDVEKGVDEKEQRPKNGDRKPDVRTESSRPDERGPRNRDRRHGGPDGGRGGDRRHDGPDARGRHDGPDARGRHDGPDARGRHDGPDARGRHDGPDARGRHDGPDARGRHDGPDTRGGDRRDARGGDRRHDGPDARGRRDGSDARGGERRHDGPDARGRHDGSDARGGDRRHDARGRHDGSDARGGDRRHDGPDTRGGDATEDKQHDGPEAKRHDGPEARKHDPRKHDGPEGRGGDRKQYGPESKRRDGPDPRKPDGPEIRSSNKRHDAPDIKSDRRHETRAGDRRHDALESRGENVERKEKEGPRRDGQDNSRGWGVNRQLERRPSDQKGRRKEAPSSQDYVEGKKSDKRQRRETGGRGLADTTDKMSDRGVVKKVSEEESAGMAVSSDSRLDDQEYMKNRGQGWAKGQPKKGAPRREERGTKVGQDRGPLPQRADRVGHRTRVHNKIAGTQESQESEVQSSHSRPEKGEPGLGYGELLDISSVDLDQYLASGAEEHLDSAESQPGLDKREGTQHVGSKGQSTEENRARSGTHPLHGVGNQGSNRKSGNRKDDRRKSNNRRVEGEEETSRRLGVGRGRGRDKVEGRRPGTREKPMKEEQKKGDGKLQPSAVEEGQGKEETAGEGVEASSSQQKLDVAKLYDLNSHMVAVVDDIAGQNPEEVLLSPTAQAEFVEVTSKKAQKEKVRKEKEEQRREEKRMEDQRKKKKPAVGRGQSGGVDKSAGVSMNKPYSAWSTTEERDSGDLWDAAPGSQLKAMPGTIVQAAAVQMPWPVPTDLPTTAFVLGKGGVSSGEAPKAAVPHTAELVSSADATDVYSLFGRPGPYLPFSPSSAPTMLDAAVDSTIGTVTSPRTVTSHTPLIIDPSLHLEVLETGLSEVQPIRVDVKTDGVGSSRTLPPRLKVGAGRGRGGVQKGMGERRDKRRGRPDKDHVGRQARQAEEVGDIVRET